jgi:hypothetical protein
VDWIFFQCWCGKSANAVSSSLASNSISLTFGNCRPSMSATVSSWVRTWTKTVRIVAATISAEPFGITVKTLRMKSS